MHMFTIDLLTIDEHTKLAETKSEDQELVQQCIFVSL